MSFMQKDILNQRLLTAAEEGDQVTVEYILKNYDGIINIDVRDEKHGGCTPLQHATGTFRGKSGNFNVMKLLLDNKANVNCTDSNALTPLHIACSNGDIEIVQLLLSHNAEVNVKDKKYGDTPLHFCICIEETPSSNIIVQLLIDNNAKVDSKNNSGWTPLHYASKCGHTSIVEVLLQNGANISIPSPRFKKTAEAIAKERLYRKGLCHETVNYFYQFRLKMRREAFGWLKRRRRNNALSISSQS